MSGVYAFPGHSRPRIRVRFGEPRFLTIHDAIRLSEAGSARRSLWTCTNR